MNSIFESKSQKFLILISIINLFYSTFAFAESKTPYVGLWACNMIDHGGEERSSSITEWKTMRVTKDTISFSGEKSEKINFEKTRKKNEYPFSVNNVMYQFFFPDYRYYVMFLETSETDEVCIKISEEDEAKLKNINPKSQSNSEIKNQNTNTQTNSVASNNLTAGSKTDSEMCFRGNNYILDDPSYCLGYTKIFTTKSGQMTQELARNFETLRPLFRIFSEECPNGENISPDEKFKRGQEIAAMNIGMIEKGMPVSNFRSNIDYCSNVVSFYTNVIKKMSKQN